MDKVRFTIHTVTGRDITSDVVDLDFDDEGVAGFVEAIDDLNSATSISLPSGGNGYVFNPRHIVSVATEIVDES